MVRENFQCNVFSIYISQLLKTKSCIIVEGNGEEIVLAETYTSVGKNVAIARIMGLIFIWIFIEKRKSLKIFLLKKNRHFYSIRTLWVKEKKTDRELFQRCISTRFICALFSYLHRGVKSLPKKCTKDFWDFVRILL